MLRTGKLCKFAAETFTALTNSSCSCNCLRPLLQSTIKGRVEIGGAYLPSLQEHSLKKISARKILYLYVAPRTFTGECCNITYLYSVDPDPCVVGQEHEDTYLYRCRLHHLCTGGGYQLNLVGFFKISLSDKNLYKNYGCVR